MNKNFSIMKETGDNEEVSSSSSVDESLKDAPLARRGTPICLKTKVLKEWNKALYVQVDYGENKYNGVLLESNPTDSWEPQRMQVYSSIPEKVEKSKIQKMPETKECGMKRTQTKLQTFSVSEHPLAFVNSINIVESKLRFGRDTRVTSCSSCPSSPRRDNSGTSAFSNSGSYVNSVSVSSSDLRINSSLNVENFLDKTFIPASESSTLPFKKTDDHHSPPQKIKNCKQSRTFETESGTKRTQRKGFTSLTYPRCFVNSSNIIESKLRYGRDMQVTSSRSCPSSPRLDNSRNTEFNNSASDTNSVSVSDRAIKITSLNLDGTFTPASESSTLPRIFRINWDNADKGTPCKEVDITKTIDNSMNKFDNKLEQDNDSMLRIPGRDIEETDETSKDNWNSIMSPESIENNDGMPNLQPIESHSPRLKRVSGTCSDNSSSIVKGFAEVSEKYSAVDSMLPSNF